LKVAVDTSALLAVIFQEPEALSFRTALIDSDCVAIGPSLIEAFMVMSGREISNVEGELAGLVQDTALSIIPFDQNMTTIAQQAFLKYGKGRHPAKLNFGDCMSYALAKSLGIPLLYKGNDFALTDIDSALDLFSSE
jgi:ribonuclease VapC